MYPSSTQHKYWTFKNEDDLNAKRLAENEKFRIEMAASNPNVLQSSDSDNELLPADEYFLTIAEERELIKHYEQFLIKFCQRFEPPMPKCVSGTSMQLFKRFYMRNTPMNYHPKEILFTIIFLACKVEEFNISIEQFVKNVTDERAKIMDNVLFNEMLVLSKLNFQLFVHNPFRPVEGLLLDIKVRSNMQDPECLRPHIEKFLDSVLLTDACLLYAPSQVALTSVLHAASREQENLDSYVMQQLFGKSPDKKHLNNIVTAVRKIRLMVNNYTPPVKEHIEQIEKKLAICRNPAYNPESEVCKERLRAIYANEDQTNNMPVAITNTNTNTNTNKS